MTSRQPTERPRVVWTPGETLALAVAATSLAATTVVWAATHLAVLAATGRFAAFSFGDAAATTASLLLDPADPVAALPAGIAVDAPGAWWTALAALTVVAAAGGWWVHRLLRRDAAPTAGWATARQLTDLHVPHADGHRVVLGRAGRRLVAAEASQAVIVLGPARSGKTAGLAIPAILEWDGPVLATSVRTDLVDTTHAARRRRGRVWVYDPSRTATGENDDMAGWDPLVGCEDWQHAQRTAAALCSAGSRKVGGGDGDFWYAVAAKLLAPLLYAAAQGAWTMADVVRWVDTQEEVEVRTALQASGNTAALQAALATWHREARTRSSAYTTAEVVLAAFQDPAVLASTEDAEISTEALFDGGAHTLYVCAPAHEQDRLRPLFTALLAHVIRAAYTRHATGQPLVKPLLIVLDEAANIAPLRDLDAIASTAAGCGIQLVTVWQDLAQIQTRYGQRAATVVNNHRAKLVLSGVSDEPTLRYLTILVGDHEQHHPSVSVDSTGKTVTSTGTPVYRPLAPAEVLRRIPAGQGLLIYGHLPPARLQLRPWYRDRHLTHLAQGGSS